MSRAPSPDMEAVGLFSLLASPVQAEDTSAGVSEPVGSPDAPSGADQFDSIFGTPTFSSRQVSPACCLASPSHSKRSNSATQQAPPTASPSHSKRSSSATPNSPPTTLPSHRSPSTTGSTPKTPSGPVERLDIQRKYPTLEVSRLSGHNPAHSCASSIGSCFAGHPVRAPILGSAVQPFLFLLRHGAVRTSHLPLLSLPTTCNNLKRTGDHCRNCRAR